MVLSRVRPAGLAEVGVVASMNQRMQPSPISLDTPRLIAQVNVPLRMYPWMQILTLGQQSMTVQITMAKKVGIR